MKRPLPSAAPPRRGHRIVIAAFGVFFVGLAGVVLALASAATLLGSLAAAAVLGLLGVDACVSAWRGRPSLMERIGPLP
ncbi:hypothetical protein [Piscinibacter koreensis]|uniref:Uncharacterized protein n=1 Tax=Piscinibacter koreensis TaxID=2742824 RepID=A0A7Y6TVW7_9BURK|nr:hypothetical protein [Schlegelella koreensis]NUZ05376.1 hypothetical protein [Schlegelella koreensis]